MDGISVIMPAHNEEHEAGKVLSKLKESLAAIQLPFEIIAVNDASTDNTHAILTAHSVRVIDNARNVGYGASIKNGLRVARFDTIAIIDADNTYPAGDIPALLKHMTDHDMVVGRRRLICYQRLNWLKQRGRNAIDLLCSYLAGTMIPDINSGLRLFKKARAFEFMDELCDRFSFTTSMTLLMFFSGRRVLYVPIDYCCEPTMRQTKVRIWKDGYRTLLLILSLGFRHVPVRTAFLAALPLIIITGVLLLV